MTPTERSPSNLRKALCFVKGAYFGTFYPREDEWGRIPEDDAEAVCWHAGTILGAGAVLAATLVVDKLKKVFHGT